MHVGVPITVEFPDRSLRGELIGVPFMAGKTREHLKALRSALETVCHYCERRKTRIVGLGALLPAMTDFGKTLLPHVSTAGITTGHSFTAHAIAEHVRLIESLLGGPQRIAIVGAAGSTGKASHLALRMDGVERPYTLIDLPEKARLLEASLPTNSGNITVSADLCSIQNCSVVICVTNASAAIIRAEHLAEGAIVIDDAQPENITVAVARERPDVTVIKCLARVPGLRCPFDFGLFAEPPTGESQEISFTCLAEVVALAAHDHTGHFTVGTPTVETIAHVASLARAREIDIAPFHGFPEIGELTDLPSKLRTRQDAFLTSP